METLFHYVAPPSQCGYLSDQQWSLEYQYVGAVQPGEYMNRMAAGWRRFGSMVFRPRCQSCNACRSLRVVVDRFRPNRSQKRAWQTNVNDVQVVVGEPSVTRAKLRLYDHYHAYQTVHKAWPLHPAKDAESYENSFVTNPFPTEEWCYYIGRQLAGVGYVDALPGGLSAIYFYYDPELRHRSLGTFNILCLIRECQERRLPHLYLGYFVSGCASLSYKADFAANEILGPDGKWHDFRTG
jgi:arginine-tRNA-protein transferase